MNIPFINLKQQYSPHHINIDAAIKRISHSGQYIIRAEVKENEVPTATSHIAPTRLSNIYRHINYQITDLPISEAVSKEIFSSPVPPYLGKEKVTFICNLTKQVVN